METELKLRITPSDMMRVLNHPILVDHARATPTEHRLSDTYFDTPKLDLWRNGITLRIREDGATEEGATWTQTVKTAPASAGGLHVRGEWESRLASHVPQPAEISRQIKTDRIAKLLRSPALATALRPVFTSTTRSTVWKLELPDGQLVECSLDSGNISGGGKSVPVEELELELKKGNPTQLFQLALALHEDIPLEIASDSKAARGYALLESRPPRAVKAEQPRLTRRMSLEKAFRCIGQSCLRQIEANVPGVLLGSAENLHQMRIGLRRLRALVDMFKSLAPLPPPMQEGLDWLAQQLGAKRDWDVLNSTTLDSVTGMECDALRVYGTAKTRELHQDLLQALHGPRYTQLLLQLNSWFHGSDWRSSLSDARGSLLSRRARQGLRPLLRKAQARLHRRVDCADKRDTEAHHRIRIAAKKARYAVEFFSDLLPRKASKRYLAELTRLQDRLGHLNDLEVAKKLLSDIEACGPTHEAGYALGFINAEVQHSLSRLKRAVASARKLTMPLSG